MQRMHQSYKCMKAQQKKLVGVHPTCLLTKTQGILRKPIIVIYKPSSIMKDSHQYMKVTTQETLYHEDRGATLKHKCGKRIVALSLLSFSLIFIYFYFFIWAFSPFLWPLFLVQSLIPTCDESQSPSSFPHQDNALIMKIITLLFTYNSRITTRYLEQNMSLCRCLRQCIGMCNESRVTCMKNYEWWLCHKYDVNYMIMQGNMTMMERVIINGTVESCMAIYLGMAMEMP